MTPIRKLAIVVGVQVLILLSVLGFKQYTIWTGETVVLAVAPVDPRDLIRGDYMTVQYDISTLDPDKLAGDEYPSDRVYVELRESEGGTWDAVAIHDGRERSFDDTVLLKGDMKYRSFRNGDELTVDYGIEEIFIPEGSGSQLPFGDGHTVAVEVKVDRFGNAVPRRFLVDGEPFELERR